MAKKEASASAYWADKVPPIAGYVNWYDAADESTVTITSGVVSAWNDKGSAAHNASQGTAGLRPGRIRAWPSGLLALMFDGVDDRLGSSMDMSDQTSSFFVVACPTANDVDTKAFLGPSADDALEMRSQTAGGIIALHADVALIGQTNTKTYTPAEPFAVGMTQDATNCKFFLEDEAYNTVHAQTTTAGRTAVIGGAPSVAGGEPFEGWIGEIIKYSTQLTDAEAFVILAYLEQKWRIPGRV